MCLLADFTLCVPECKDYFFPPNEIQEVLSWSCIYNRKFISEATWLTRISMLILTSHSQLSLFQK